MWGGSAAAELCHAVQCRAELCHAVLSCVDLCCAIPFRTMLSRAVLCRAMLSHAELNCVSSWLPSHQTRALCMCASN